MDEMEPMVAQVDWETEPYTANGPGTELAQLIYDTGLMYQVNCAVLHPQGLALGVSVTDDEPRHVYGLNLHRTSDPEGVWFDESLTSVGRRKLLNAGLLLRSPQRQSKHPDIRPELDSQDDNDVWRRQANVKRVLAAKGVRLHDDVVKAIVEAACDPALRSQADLWKVEEGQGGIVGRELWEPPGGGVSGARPERIEDEPVEPPD